MSTLTEMREALELLEQDAARFRWIASNPQVAEAIFCHVIHAEPEDVLPYVRLEIDAARVPTQARSVDTGGAQT